MPGTMKRIAIATAVLCFALPAWGASGTRVSSFEYDPVTGLLLKEIVEPDTAQLRLDTTYVRDGYGNKTSATITSPATGEAAIVSRSATATFDSQGRFNTVTTNALSHSETKAYDTRFGLPTSHTSPNSQVSQWQYDGFGRKTLEIAPDGNRTQFQYLFCSGVAGGSATCPTNAKYVVRATPRAADGVTQNGPIKSVYFDALDREIRSETQGFDGSLIITAKQFDTRGRLLQASRPYFSSQTPKWIAYQYDDLARMTRQTEPNSAITQYAYNGLVYTVTNALSQTRTETKNSQGKVITVRDHLNGTTTFAFDPFENLTKVTDAVGNISSMGYDLRGRKTSMTDPDMGAWTYIYDAVGQMVRQVDAKAQEIVTGYDKLGRMTARSSSDLTSSWVYDTATNGIGKVASMATTAGFAKSLTYDSLSRPSQSSTTIDGQTYSSTSTYDANGRLATVVYPSGFTVRYVYTALGYQSEARNDATSALFWRADTMNAELQLTAFTHGNNVATTQAYDANTGRLTTTQAGTGNTVQNAGYVWDNVGNMTQRADATQALVETFIHDGLNRLTSSEIFGSPAKTVTYNAIGNIVTKSDVGTYTYPTTGSARPHAVASIAGSLTTSFTYDANGNMLTGNARTLTWTSFNMPATIARGAATVGFTYDPEYNRIKQTTPDGATHYLWDSASGINIEKFIGSGGSTQWSNYVFAGGQMVAVFYERTPGPSATRYFHKDHLGSLAVITDEAGAVSERLAYDSWGKRRHANGADDPGEAITSQANRGYTGHEHLEEVGLVHMNGRIYEPLVARFMSADPIVQDPFSTQSLNRYSYVMNNPMAHTDPTGFQMNGWGVYNPAANDPIFGGAGPIFYGNGFLFLNPQQVQFTFRPETNAPLPTIERLVGESGPIGISFKNGRTLYTIDDVFWTRDEEGKLWAGVPINNIQSSRIPYKSSIYFSGVPGQRMLDGMMNKIEEGNYASAGMYFSGMLAEQVLTVAFIGMGGTATGAPQSFGKFAANLETQSSAASFSQIVPGGGLAAHEAAGGHLLLKHVGKTESQLMARFAAEPNIKGSSSFYNRVTAESAVSNALDANAGNISKWLSSSPQQRLMFEHTTQSAVGISIRNGANSAVDSNTMRILLVRDPQMSIGYRIQTGFPLPP